MARMIEVNSEHEMQQFGERLGQLMKGGEVIELIGDVGAGKTTLVRGLAAGMGVQETVQSPSFTISRLYDAADEKRLAHYDFYRLSDAGIMSQELSEMIGTRGTVVVIEWAGAVEEVLPADRLTIVITAPSQTLRQLMIQGGGTVSNRLTEALYDPSP
jgi:tRNA threonylcarbamoyladenosine biosynthesis protein TsaE